LKHYARRILCLCLALLFSLSTALAYSRLELGDEGSEVLAMQKALKQLGYSITTDGDFGPATQAAVRLFQSKNGLKVDGIAGNDTLTRLYAQASGSASPDTNQSGSSVNPKPGTSSGISAVVTTSGGSLSLRLSQSTSAQVLASIPNGTRLTILQKGDTWSYLLYGGIGGYVLTQYLSFGNSAPTPTPTPSQNHSSASGIVATVVTTGGSLNMRSRASGGTNIIGSIPNGAKVVVLSRGAEWCQVVYNGKTGYVMSSFLSFASATPVPPTMPPTATPTPTKQPTLSGVYATVKTTSGSLNLRSNPSGGTNILTTVPNGSRILVTARGAQWCMVSFNGYTGYVMSEFLVFASDATAAPTAAPTAIPTTVPTAAPMQPPAQFQPVTQMATVYTADGGTLNMRRTASYGNNIIDVIPCGSYILVSNRGVTWSQVTYAGKTGYVLTSYLRFDAAATSVPTASPTPVPAPTVPPSAGQTAYVSTSGGSLNFRANAAGNAQILGTIPNNAAITVLQRGSTWCSVYYNGVYGYVMTSFLRFPVSVTPVPTASPTPVPVPDVSGRLIAVVTTSGGTLNFRDQPNTGGKVLDYIPNGASLTVTARGSSWCAVVYNGVSGYVMTSFLTFLNTGASATPLPTQAPDNSGSSGSASMYATVVTSGGTLNLRAEKSTNAKILWAIPNGETLMVYEKGATWCGVTYAGTSGYVMTQYLSFLSSVPAQTPTPDNADPSQYVRTLKKGMIGADVDWVQSRLISLGYTLIATGTYDDQTISAVKAFQSQNALSTDGLAGSQTFSMLRSSNARRADDPPLNYDTLRVDDQGEAVRSMQRALKELGYQVTVNGDFDAATHNAVVAFQQRNGLVISGIADSLTRQIIHSENALPYSTPVETLPPHEGVMALPAREEIQLLHWQNEIKPNVKTGQTYLILDPNTGISWNLKFYALGRHADSQPATWRDTQLMNRSFGSTSWTIHPVYVLLPTGQWTMATMHNMPHLYGSINDNGFGGHLCVHFLRDMSEAKKNDPNYGVKNQNALRSAWKALTGETIE